MASVHVERTGVVRDEKTGETFIPASRRPDGTWRKPRRVKDGYIPQEEVPVYESKGMQWLNSMPTLPPGFNPIENTDEKLTKAQKKQKKSAESQKQILKADSPEFVAKQIDSLIIMDSKKKVSTNSTSDEFKVVSSKKSSKSKSKNVSKTPVAVETEKINANKKSSKLKPEDNLTSEEAKTDPVKRLRNLKKKIRQIEELEEKIKTKELPNPSQEQLDKVSRKDDVKKEIEKLELIV